MKKLLFLPVFLLFSISLIAQDRSTTTFRADTRKIGGEVNYLNVIVVAVDEGVTPSDYMPAVFNRVWSGLKGGVPGYHPLTGAVFSVYKNKKIYICVNHYEYNGVSYYDRNNFREIPYQQEPTYRKYPEYVDIIFSVDNGIPSYTIQSVF